MTTSLPHTPFLHTHVRVRDLCELIAGIPYVLGFPPTDSLVLFTFRRCPTLALSTTMRVDLPVPEHVPQVVEQLLAAVVNTGAVATTAVVVGGAAEDHRLLLDTLRTALAENDILLTHASWVRRVAHGEQWQCYDDPLCTGLVPDPQTSALAAALAVAGDTTYADRASMAAQLAPDPKEALARREELLDDHLRQPGRPYDEAELAADLEVLEAALEMSVNSRELPTLNDRQLVRLASALSHPAVRDECLAAALTDDPQAAERLWTVLVRALPAPERAEPAVLLAMSTYLRGAGVLASMALQTALEANPGHTTATLLNHALRSGVPPDRIRDMLMESVSRSERYLAPVTDEEDDDPPPWDTPPEPTTPELPSAESWAGQGVPTPIFSAEPDPEDPASPGLAGSSTRDAPDSAPAPAGPCPDEPLSVTPPGTPGREPATALGFPLPARPEEPDPLRAFLPSAATARNEPG
jgi:hypothetical protein